MKPLVSICIPTYNGKQYLQEALDSIEKQTYNNIEVIISDDESTDGTINIVGSFIDTSRFPAQIIHHKPSGIGSNWNSCVRHANGKFIKFLFQDDLLHPDCISKMVGKLENDPNLVAVACQREFREEKNDFSKWKDKYGFLQVGLNDNKEEEFVITKEHLKLDTFFQSPTNKIGEPTAVMFKRCVINTIGLFNENLVQILDHTYWCKLLTVGDICILPESLVTFRLHENQATHQNSNKKVNESKAYRRFIYRNLHKFISHDHYKDLRYEFHPLWRLKNAILTNYHINF